MTVEATTRRSCATSASRATRGQWHKANIALEVAPMPSHQVGQQNFRRVQSEEQLADHACSVAILGERCVHCCCSSLQYHVYFQIYCEVCLWLRILVYCIMFW